MVTDRVVVYRLIYAEVDGTILNQSCIWTVMPASNHDIDD